jgi:hypothetical protein
LVVPDGGLKVALPGPLDENVTVWPTIGVAVNGRKGRAATDELATGRLSGTRVSADIGTDGRAPDPDCRKVKVTVNGVPPATTAGADPDDPEPTE